MNLASLILSSIALLVQNYADYDKETDYVKTLSELKQDLNLPTIKTYDFIVVGGGTAGSLMAGRLSEKFNVLLLERGGNPVPTTANPFLNAYSSAHPAINNIFLSVPQFNFSQERGGIIKTHTGRMLGGSGSHNGNVFNRGSPYDYDNFADITGDATWSFKNVLNHFKRFERFVGRLTRENERTDFYGTRGPLTVTSEMPPITTSWFQSAKELGYNVCDPGNQVEGFAPVAMSMKNGERESTYTAFVKPHQQSRSRLTVLTYSEVEQVLINSNKVAYGVVYRRHGMIQIAHASKEIIVSCGTISSPMLLIKSGIGPKEVLEKAKIPVMNDLKGVGKNFRDHGAVILRFTVNNPNTTLLPRINNDEDLEQEIMKYHGRKRSGFMTRMDVGPQAFIVSSRAKADGQPLWPDIQIVFFQPPVMSKSDPQATSLQIVLNRMKSSGEIGFNTTAYLNGDRDDTKLALIDFRLFSNPTDTDTLIEGIQLGLRIMENTTSFQKMSVEYTEASPEKCRTLPFRSHEYWQCYIKQRGYSWLHCAGTCSMGPASDPLAVVDSKLRVRGIQSLRVADASVMPRPTNANTNAAVMLVAEKVSQDILSFYAANSRTTTAVPF